MNTSIHINKTYKLYIDGKFSRTESGRYMKWVNPNNDQTINILDVISLINLVLSNNYDSSGDLNTDNNLNILDISQIALYQFGLLSNE